MVVPYLPSLPAPSGLPYQVAAASDQWVAMVDMFKCFGLMANDNVKKVRRHKKRKCEELVAIVIYQVLCH